MAGTRTAPSVDGTPTYKQISIALLDFSGDLRSVSLRVPAGATNAQIEAVVAKLQASTQASIYRVEVQYVYEGAVATSNATSDENSSVFDNISIGFKDTGTGASQTAYIPAPITSLMGAGDIVKTGETAYTEYRDAARTALAGNYAARFTRFSERREINKRQPAT